MSSLFGFAEQALSAATGGGSSDSQDEVRRTGGREYNTPRYDQRPHGGYDTEEVLSHANDDDEGNQEYIRRAVQHVHNNPDQHQEQVDRSDLDTYGPMIKSALSSVGSSKSGFDVSSLISGSFSGSGGNQLMGLVMKEAGNAFTGGSGGDKQSMMNGAAMTLTKLVAQNQLSAFIGGGNSGGLGMLGSIGGSLLKSQFA